MTKQINISILYDQLLIAEGFKAILSNVNGLHVSKLTENNAKYNQSINPLEIDLFIIELSDISKQNIEYVNCLRESFPNQKTLVVSGSLTRELLEYLISIVNGYMLRTCSSEKLILAIHEIIENDNFLCSQLIPILFDNNHKNGFNIDLTKREKEILSLLYTTNHNSEIAEILNISQTTVRTHLKNIRHKSGNKNEVQMMRYACNKNLLKENCIPLCPNCRFYYKKNGK
ncbi:DNA-binding response regulator [Ancylomarina sp.]|uniref:DNA-binding response regulator n=1 Tax=Ancylomarina sp. TaxID=1970196 RepID=UPI00356200BC